MKAAAERGTDQFVILGAGLDTFAYRMPFRYFVRIVEIDHPATQAWKKRLLAAAGIAVPPTLTLSPVDLGEVSLLDALARAGVNMKRPVFVSWLGVVYYLPLPAVETALRTIGGLSEGSELVFDYLVTPDLLGWEARAELLGGAKSVAAAGEPWVTFFDPAALVEKLGASGFAIIDNFTSQVLSGRFGLPQLAAYEQGGVIHATVG